MALFYLGELTVITPVIFMATEMVPPQFNSIGGY